MKLNDIIEANVNINYFWVLYKQTIQHNAYDQDPYAKEFGIKISEKLASVEARILPAPWVCMLLQTTFILCNILESGI